MSISIKKRKAAIGGPKKISAVIQKVLFLSFFLLVIPREDIFRFNFLHSILRMLFLLQKYTKELNVTRLR
jgi:hypothetical protein